MISVFKRFNLCMEFDPLANSVYIYFPPYSSKYPPHKITKTECKEEKDGTIINFDYFNEKLAGIEIIGAKQIIDLKLD